MDKTVDKKQIERVRKMAFCEVYPLYIQKAERKGYGKKDVDAVIKWLTGYTDSKIAQHIKNSSSFEVFFTKADKFNPLASKITGSICGYRIEEIEDEIVRKVRYLDKLVDDLVRGKTLDDIVKKLNR